MKNVIYTCITNKYDKLNEITNKQEGYDYICFTDDNTLTSTTWTIKEIPDDLKDLNGKLQMKALKILPHKYLSNYDLSIWIDGNIPINFNINEFIQNFIDDKHSIFAKQHPFRKCAYQEAKICIKTKKDTKEHIEPQMEQYKKDGFPYNFGLSENNFIVRFHNEQDCIKLMEMWFNEVKTKSTRDQLSYQYCIWKTKTNVKYFNGIKNLSARKHTKIKS